MSLMWRNTSEQSEFDRYYSDGDGATAVLDAEPKKLSALRRCCNSLSGPLLIGIGLIAYELTAQPVLGALIAFSKSGWDDLLTACWLRRRDPDRRRAAACFWLYLASGAWKVAITAYLATGVLVWSGMCDFLPAAFLEAVIGIALCTLATVWGALLAWRNDTPVWVSSNVRRARRKQLWPPPPFLVTGKSQGERLLLIVLTVSGVIGCTILTMLLGGDPMLGCFIFTAGVIVGWTVVIHTKESTIRRIIAGEPADCWPEGVLDSV